MALLKTLLFLGMGMTIFAINPISAGWFEYNTLLPPNERSHKVSKAFKLTFYKYFYCGNSLSRLKHKDIFKVKKQKIEDEILREEISSGKSNSLKMNLEEERKRKLDQLKIDKKKWLQNFLDKAEFYTPSENTLWPRYYKKDKYNEVLGFSTAYALSEFCDPNSSDGLLIIDVGHEIYGPHTRSKYECPISLKNMLLLNEEVKNYSRMTQIKDEGKGDFWVQSSSLIGPGRFSLVKACYDISACCSSGIEVILESPVFDNLLNIKVVDPYNKDPWRNVYNDVRELFYGSMGINQAIMKFLEINSKYGTNVESTHTLTLMVNNSNNEIQSVAYAYLKLQESNNPCLDPTFLENTNANLGYFLRVEKD